MGKIDVAYGGGSYAITGADIDAVQKQIEAILESGKPGWLEAYDGHGSRAPYQLLIGAGIAIGICEAPSE